MVLWDCHPAPPSAELQWMLNLDDVASGRHLAGPWKPPKSRDSTTFLEKNLFQCLTILMVKRRLMMSRQKITAILTGSPWEMEESVIHAGAKRSRPTPVLGCMSGLAVRPVVHVLCGCRGSPASPLKQRSCSQLHQRLRHLDGLALSESARESSHVSILSILQQQLWIELSSCKEI